MPSPRSNGANPRNVPMFGQKIYANGLSDAVLRNKLSVVNRFASRPIIEQYGTQGSPVTVPTMPTAAAGNIGQLVLLDAFGNQFLEHYQSTAQTLMPSLHATKGLLISGDLVDNESQEFCFGGNHVNNPISIFTGTSSTQGDGTNEGGFIFRATFEIADVSGMDQFGLLIRKQEDYAVPVSFLSGADAGYTDFNLFGFAAAGGATAIVRSATDIANSGVNVVSSTGFAVSDGGIVTLEMRVIGRKVYYYINGVPCGTPVKYDGAGASITQQNTQVPTSYTFGYNLNLIPDLFIRNDATTPGAVYMRDYMVGPLTAFGLNPDGRTGDSYSS